MKTFVFTVVNCIWRAKYFVDLIQLVVVTNLSGEFHLICLLFC